MAETLLDHAAESLVARAAAARARPADIPEKFWDAQKGEVRIDALLKSYRELERRLARLSSPPGDDAGEEERSRFRRALGAPDTPEAYAIEERHPLCCADAEINRRLHAHGFTQAQAQLVYDLAAERLLPLIAEAAGQFEADRQIERLIQHYGGEDRFRTLSRQIGAWGRANLPAPVFEALACTSDGVMTMHRMMEGEEPGIVRGAGAPIGVRSENELRAMVADPRYWKMRDPDFVRRVGEGFRRLFASES
ncbi:MAG: hypothetical protein IT557_09915 [Alphaproteobacteria bacterium]|nr:hypothetical protein [Alphaproteobacteria bacterium]